MIKPNVVQQNLILDFQNAQKGRKTPNKGFPVLSAVCVCHSVCSCVRRGGSRLDGVWINTDTAPTMLDSLSRIQTNPTATLAIKLTKTQRWSLSNQIRKMIMQNYFLLKCLQSLSKSSLENLAVTPAWSRTSSENLKVWLSWSTGKTTNPHVW